MTQQACLYTFCKTPPECKKAGWCLKAVRPGHRGSVEEARMSEQSTDPEDCIEAGYDPVCDECAAKLNTTECAGRPPESVSTRPTDRCASGLGNDEESPAQTTDRDWWDWANGRAQWLADLGNVPRSERLIWMQACLEIFDCIRRNGGAPK